MSHGQLPRRNWQYPSPGFGYQPAGFHHQPDRDGRDRGHVHGQWLAVLWHRQRRNCRQHLALCRGERQSQHRRPGHLHSRKRYCRLLELRIRRRSPTAPTSLPSTCRWFVRRDILKVTTNNSTSTPTVLTGTANQVIGALVFANINTTTNAAAYNQQSPDQPDRIVGHHLRRHRDSECDRLELD